MMPVNHNLELFTMTSSALPKMLEARPLYVRAREALIARMISGEWKPGQAIPSEFAIAAELGVSQGTVRKALDEMTKQGLLMRRQGKGTYVAEAQDNDILFRFYRLTRDEDDAATGFPDSTYLARQELKADDAQATLFNCKQGATLWRFERLRSSGGNPILWEELLLPAHRFPDLTSETNLPNNVYQFYGEHYGIIVESVSEKIKAVALPEKIAPLLAMESGAPVLQIERRATALDGACVEWRRSLCRCDSMHYRNLLR